MKLKIALSAGLWLVLITTAHVWLNVGFKNLGHELRVMMGEEREVLKVGFLPVT